jgi:nucleoside-diphosphate-sugar epimerase
VLVLGAAGFIGRWVSSTLFSAGALLTLAVRDAAAAQAVFGEHGISGDVEVVDLADATAVQQLLDRTRPSVTFNLAGYGVDPSERDPSMATALNEDLPRLLAERADAASNSRWRGRVVVHAASGIEYGSAAGLVAEDTPPQPVSTYARSKLAGTDAIARAAGGRCIAARLFTVYGPGEHSGRLLPSILQLMRNNADLSLTAGAQLRDFTSVEDVADGLLRVGATMPDDTRVVNLATGRMTSVRRFAEIAADVAGVSRDRLRFGELPGRPDEMGASRVAVARAERMLHWVPGTDIRAGIERTVNFYKRLASADDNHIV